MPSTTTHRTYPRMLKKYKDPWIKALRSGKFPQIKKVLKSDNGYCCLGVLCEINKIPQKRLPNGLSYVFTFDTLWASDAKIDTGYFNSLFYKRDLQTSEYAPLVAMNLLVNYNDGGKSFDLIADWIEENL